MTLRVLGAAMVLTGLTTSLAHADSDSDIPENILTVAARENLSPVDLQAALNTLHEAGYDVDAEAYVAPQPVHALTRTMRVRLTYYVESGVTYSGGHPYAGSTACSWNLAIGTRVRLPDGEVFTCNDRGMLGSSGWLDLWRAPATVAKYGPYATVEVIP